MRTYTAASLIALVTLASGLGAAEASGRDTSAPRTAPAVVRGIDAVALALASPHTPHPVDRVVTVGRLHGWGAGAVSRSTAGSTADCDGCTAEATTLAVVYGNSPGQVRAANLATSTTTACSDCGTVSISVQVILLRRAGTVQADNRASAVNAGCTGCRASSAAYQTVVVDPRGRPLSSHDLAVLRDWVEDQADQMAAQGPAPSQRRGAATVSPQSILDQKLKAALGPDAKVTTKVDAVTG